MMSEYKNSKLTTSNKANYPQQNKAYYNQPNMSSRQSNNHLLNDKQNPELLFFPEKKSISNLNSKKKGVEANHLLNIQFEKSSANVSNISSISSSSTRRNKNFMNRNRNSNSVLTKNQFLQANYKFIISPCINNFDEGFYNPDCLISWELVEEVVVPAVTSESELLNIKCPICLAPSVLPRITKCGHIFCFVCTLQYLGPEFRKKCPICSDKISRDDLKSVKYTSVQEPELNKLFTFHLVRCEKGTIQPKLVDEENSYKKSYPPPNEAINNGLFPSLDVSKNSRFSRITTATPEYLESLLLSEQQKLIELRECSLDVSNADCNTEWLPYIAEAVALVTTRMQNNLEIKNQSPLHANSIPKCRKDRTGSNLSESEDMPTIFVMDGFNLDEELNSNQKENAEVTHGHQNNDESSTPSYIPSSSYFYQSSDGELVFLHSISFKPIFIQAESDFTLLPKRITATVLEVEKLRVTESSRLKLPFTRHLPLQCNIMLVEIELKNIVDKNILVPFQDEIKKREKIRKKKMNLYKREKKVEKDAILSHEISVQGMKEKYRLKLEKEQAIIDELLSGPVVGNRSSENDACKSDLPNGSSSSATTMTNNNLSLSSTPPTQSSFAKVTQMGGHFPSLSETFETISSNYSASISSSSPTVTTGVWGNSKLSISPTTSQSMSKNYFSPAAKISISSENQDRIEKEGATSSKNFKKSKGVQLFSNAGGRLYTK